MPPTRAKKLYALTDAYGYEASVSIYWLITGMKFKFFANGSMSTKSSPRLDAAAMPISLSAFFQSLPINSIWYKYKNRIGVKMSVCGLIRMPIAKKIQAGRSFFSQI